MRIDNHASWLEIVDWLKKEYENLTYGGYSNSDNVTLLHVVIWVDDDRKEVIKLPITTVPVFKRLIQAELDRWKEKHYVVKKHSEQNGSPVQTLFVWGTEVIDQVPAQLPGSDKIPF